MGGEFRVFGFSDALCGFDDFVSCVVWVTVLRFATLGRFGLVVCFGVW